MSKASWQRCSLRSSRHQGDGADARGIYTRDQLMDAMYRDERVVADRTVDSHIKKSRKKISAALPDREVVHSVYGLGYKYEW
jgi:DNA-binding response OmpR family regulator